MGYYFIIPKSLLSQPLSFNREVISQQTKTCIHVLQTCTANVTRGHSNRGCSRLYQYCQQVVSRSQTTLQAIGKRSPTLQAIGSDHTQNTRLLLPRDKLVVTLPHLERPPVFL